MLKKLYFVVALLLLQTGLTKAQVWTDSVEVGFKQSATTIIATKLKIWIPSGLNPVKGLLVISGKGVGGTFSNALAFNDTIRAAAASRNTAIIAWYSSVENQGIDTTFNAGLNHNDSLVRALTKISARVNLPYLINCPIFFVGTHTSATTAVSIAYTASTQFIGVAAINSTALTSASNALANVPTLVIDGDLSGPDVTNNSNVNFGQGNRIRVLARRSAGEPITHVVVRGGGYRSMNQLTANYFANYFRNIYDLRVPANANPQSGVVAVNNISGFTPWLATSVFGSSTASDYRIAAVGGTLTPSTSFWLPSQSAANAWRAFHTPTLVQNVAPNFNTINASFPFCSGTNSGGVIVDYTSPGFAGFYNQGNVFYAELSNIYGAFDDPIVPSRVLGVYRSRSGSLTNNLATPVFIAQNPDNLQADTILRTGTTTAKYRFRIRSTSPASVSDVSIQIADIAICGDAFPIVLKNTNQFELNPGNSFVLEAFRDRRVRATPYPAGSTVRVVMSDSTGSFSGFTFPLGSTVNNFAVPGSANAVQINCTIPSNIARGLGYRIQVFVDTTTSGGTVAGSSTGGLFRVLNNGVNVGIEENLTPKAGILEVYPNPSTGEVRITGIESAAHVTITDIQGRTYGVRTVLKGEAIRLPEAKGLYLLNIKSENGTARKMVVKE